VLAQRYSALTSPWAAQQQQQPWAPSAAHSTVRKQQLRMVAAEPVAAATADAMTSYIQQNGGSLAIRKILIANNGMAGTKAILSMRQWCYLEVISCQMHSFILCKWQLVSLELLLKLSTACVYSMQDAFSMRFAFLL
jgi:hypothetical protein